MQNSVNNGRPAPGDGKDERDNALSFVLRSDAVSPTRSQSLVHSFKFAFEGIAYAFRTQRNFKLQCTITLIVVMAALLLRISLGQWEALAVVIGLVFQTELTNTAVEAIVDRVSPEFHELAKVAKDCSAAAVLVTAFSATVVGVLIFGPHILTLLSSLKL
jgi:diacylglycerol kinase